MLRRRAKFAGTSSIVWNNHSICDNKSRHKRWSTITAMGFNTTAENNASTVVADNTSAANAFKCALSELTNLSWKKVLGNFLWKAGLFT